MVHKESTLFLKLIGSFISSLRKSDGGKNKRVKGKGQIRGKVEKGELAGTWLRDRVREEGRSGQSLKAIGTGLKIKTSLVVRNYLICWG